MTGRRRRVGAAAQPVWFGAVFVVMGMGAIWLGISSARDNGRLDAEGVTVQGRIVSRHTSTDSDGARSFSVRYEFVDPATLMAHDGSSSVSSQRYATSAVGDAVTITFLPSASGTSRLGAPPFGGDPGPLLIMVFGAVFALVGAGVTYSMFRARRAAALAGPAPVPATASTAAAALAGAAVESSATQRARVDTFTRSAGRVLLDSLGPPLGGAGFLALAIFLLGQVGGDPTVLVFVGMAGFFGVLLLSGTPAILRRGLGRTMLAVGPDGLEHRDLGFLRWNEIEELRIERNIGSGGDGLAAYLRLGIVPRDPALAAGVAGGLARGLTGAFVRFANVAARRRGMGARMTDVSQVAPLGVYAYELEQPFAMLIESVRRFAPVVDAAVARAAAAQTDAANEPPPFAETSPARGPVTPEELRELDALLGRPSAVVATAELGSIIAPSPALSPTPIVEAALPRPAVTVASAAAAQAATERPRARVFYRRGASIDGQGGALEGAAGMVSALSQLWSAAIWLVFVIVPLALAANGLGTVAGGELLGGLLFLVFPLLVSFFAFGQLLGDLARLPHVTGDAELLRVGPAGITVKGFGHLPWSEVAEVRADDDTLVIRPSPDAVLDDRFWAAALRDHYLGALRRFLPGAQRRGPSLALDFALLAADRDEVLDAIAAYRVVDEG